MYILIRRKSNRNLFWGWHNHLVTPIRQTKVQYPRVSSHTRWHCYVQMAKSPSHFSLHWYSVTLFTGYCRLAPLGDKEWINTVLLIYLSPETAKATDRAWLNKGQNLFPIDCVQFTSTFVLHPRQWYVDDDWNKFVCHDNAEATRNTWRGIG